MEIKDYHTKNGLIQHISSLKSIHKELILLGSKGIFRFTNNIYLIPCVPLLIDVFLTMKQKLLNFMEKLKCFNLKKRMNQSQSKQNCYVLLVICGKYNGKENRDLVQICSTHLVVCVNLEKCV